MKGSQLKVPNKKQGSNGKRRTKKQWHIYVYIYEQTLQFATENEAKVLWLKIKNAEAAEDQKIDTSNDLKFLYMKDKETVSFLSLATKCASLGLM